MINLDRQTKGAIAEHYVVMRLLARGYAAANINMTVGNTKYFDIMCSNPVTCKAINIQVKSSYDNSRSFNIGLCHKDFMTDNRFDEIKAMKSLEDKIRCPWIFVNVQITDKAPVFRIFIMTREQVIKLAYESEKWYVNDVRHKNPLKETGQVAIVLGWIEGYDTEAEDNNRSKRKMFKNPFPANQLEEAWENLGLDD